MPTEYLEHFSLDVEYDLGHALVANLGYEGGLGRHLLYDYDANAWGHLIGAPLNPLVNGVNTFGSNGTSNNHMMLAGLKHQFSHTFSAEAQFTWAHSMDTNSGPTPAIPICTTRRTRTGVRILTSTNLSSSLASGSR